MNTHEHRTLKDIPLHRLIPHPDNPRKDLGDLSELTESVKTVGILQNLTVTPAELVDGVEIPECNEQYYVVVIGHRRLAAAKAAGLETVPCADVTMDRKEQISVMLLENIVRSDLTVYEQAHGFQQLTLLGFSADEIAQKSGFSTSTVRRRLKIAELDADTVRSVSSREPSFADFDRLQQIEDIDTRNKVLKEIGTSNFNREMQKALAEQSSARRNAAWLEIFNRYGVTEIPYSEIWDDKHKSLGWQQGEADESIVKGFAEQHEHLYYAWSTGVLKYLYIVTDKVSTEEEEAAQKERDRINDEREAARKSRADLTKNAFELRFSFIRNYSYRDSKKNIKKISDWMCLREIVSMMTIGQFNGYSTTMASKSRFAELFDVKTGDDTKPMMDFVHAHPEKALLFNVYAQWCDSETNGCFDWSGGYRQNHLLEYLYRCLVDLGYEMSDDEKRMMNGSHELFVRESGAIDTEDDEIEDHDEESDDEFDKSIAEQLDELLGEFTPD